MAFSFKPLLIRWVVLALGVMLATKIVRGISYDDGMTLFVVVLLLGFFNAILKPLLVLFTLPFILFTLGLGVIVINALLFMLVGRLVEGFHVAGFWSAAGGALVVSVTNFLVSLMVGSVRRPPGPPPMKPKDDVIDI